MTGAREVPTWTSRLERSKSTIHAYVRSTSKRAFVVIPIAVLAEQAFSRRRLRLVGVPFMVLVPVPRVTARSWSTREWIGRNPNSVLWVERTITGYHQDDVGDWVGELSCGHNQHLRHRPPFQVRAWVLDPDGRRAHHGNPIDCPLCDRTEMPEGLARVGASALWDEVTVPRGLLTSHRVALGRWGLITVREGRLRFRAQTTPPMQRVLVAGSRQPIPPEVEHEIGPLGHVRFVIEWFSTAGDGGVMTPAPPSPTSEPPVPVLDTEAGDPACWAHLICSECGALLEGTSHDHVEDAN